MPRAVLRVLALALPLAACAGGGATVVQPVERFGGPDDAIVWGGAAAIPVEVRGTPPDGSDAAAVIAALKAPTPTGVRSAVAATPGEGRRVVVAFGPAATGNLCGPAPAPAASPAAGPLTAALARCSGTRTTHRTSLRSAATLGPRDAGFERAMSLGLGELFAPRPAGRSPR